ncbi:MAG: hypothetical protein LBF57_01395 [Holosporaceae bacterium]|jgi:hypothetical protein|nr:hypothetical protein [Holosporaceae bacterium]
MKKKKQNDRTEKEVVVKKNGFLVSLLSSAIKGSLFASALVFGCAQGDVFQLQNPAVDGGGPVPITAANAAAFNAFITANQNALPVGAVDPFVGGPAVMMLGYAVFFPAAGAGAQQIYVVKKRPGNSPALHDPTVGGNPLSFSDWEHSERQLAIQLTQVARGAGAAAIPAAAAAQLLAAVVPAVPAAMPPAIAHGVGEFHIYTQQSPCTSRGPNNNGFSCVEYYAALQGMFPLGTVFHIYFNNVNIDPNYIAGNPAGAAALINVVTNLMNRPLPPVALTNRFQINVMTGALEYNQQNVNAPNVNWANAAANPMQFTNRVNIALADPALPNADKIAIFDAVFAIPNVVYHLI